MHINLKLDMPSVPGKIVVINKSKMQKQYQDEQKNQKAKYQ